MANSLIGPFAVLPAPTARRKLLEGLLTGLGLILFVPLIAAADPVTVFELDDLTLNPDITAKTERAASLGPLLVEGLNKHQQIEIVVNPDMTSDTHIVNVIRVGSG